MVDEKDIEDDIELVDLHVCFGVDRVGETSKLYDAAKLGGNVLGRRVTAGGLLEVKLDLLSAVHLVLPAELPEGDNIVNLDGTLGLGSRVLLSTLLLLNLNHVTEGLAGVLQECCLEILLLRELGK